MSDGIGVHVQTLKRMTKMQDVSTNRKFEKVVSIRLGQRQSWSIPTLSVPSPITQFINYKLYLMRKHLTIVSKTSVYKQANIDSDCQSFIASVRSLSEIGSLLRVILLAESGYFHSTVH